MENLLSTFFRYFRPGRRKFDEEDLLTECLAWLLNRSPRLRQDFAGLFVREGEKVHADVFRDSTAETQVTVEEGRWDLKLSTESLEESQGSTSEDHVLVVEVKLGARLTEKQLSKYRRNLDQLASTYRSVHLGALTPERQSGFGGLEDAPSWTRQVFWSQVQDVLASACDDARDRLHEGPSESQLDELAAFVTIGRDFSNVLEEKGLVPPRKLKPVADHEAYVAYKAGAEEGDRWVTEEGRDRFVDLAKLIIRALENGGAEDIVESSGLSLRRTSGSLHIYNHVQRRLDLDRIRRIYRFPDHSYSVVTFGLLLDTPTKGLQPREAHPDPPQLSSVELYCSLEIPDSASRSAAEWLMSEDEGKRRLDHIWEALSGRTPSFSGATPLFIPRNPSWAKLVWRASTEDWAQISVDEQIDRMGAFYREFAVMLTQRPLPPYTEEGEGLLDLLHRIHDSPQS